MVILIGGLAILIRSEFVTLAIGALVSPSVHLPRERVCLSHRVIWCTVFLFAEVLVIGVPGKRTKIFGVLHEKQWHRWIDRRIRREVLFLGFL